MSNYSSSNSSSGGGMSLLGVLQVVFIILKLCKVITWSWWLVLIPLWIELALFFILFVIIFLINKK